MLTKSMPVKVKAADDETGIVEAIVATYERDSIGDRIVPGEFKATLDDWAESAKNGAPLPYIFSHQHDNIDAYLGEVLDAKETDDGLWVKAQHDMDDPASRKVYRQLKGGRIRQWSFAYEATSTADEDTGDNLLTAIKLYEVGPTLIGMNQNTRTVSAKAAVGRHETATSDESWDGPANEADLSIDAGAGTYRQAYAWQDPDADADTKAAWKFIHHFVGDDGRVGAASTVACSAGIAILNGGRGGANIPDGDRQGVYNHLAGHLRDAGKDVPELASADAPDTSDGDDSNDVKANARASARYIMGRYGPDAAAKAGRVLSAKNEQDLRTAAELIRGVLAQLDRESSDNQGKQAHPAVPANDEEPTVPQGQQVKSEEPNQTGPVLDDLALAIAIAERS